MVSLSRPHRIFPILLLSGVVIPTVPLPTRAQPDRTDVSTPGPPAFEDRIEVRVLDLLVRVRDEAGDSVSGLEAPDFRVLLDGREVPVDFAEEVGSPDPGASVGPPRGGGVDRGVSPGDPAEDRPSDSWRRAPVSILVFFDDWRGDPVIREEARRRLLADLEDLTVRDRVGVAVARDGELEALTAWEEPGSERLREALSAETELRSAPEATMARRREEEILSGASPIGVRNYFDVKIRALASSLTAAMDRLPARDGPRSVLLFLGSWPWTTARGGFPTATDESLEEVWDRLSDVAARRGYSLYPVQTFDADPPAGGAEQGVSADDPGSGPRGEIESGWEETTEDLGWSSPGSEPSARVVESGGTLMSPGVPTLRFLAAETGGKAFLGSSWSEGLLEAVSDDLGHGYRVGITVPPELDGDEVRLEVEVVGRRLPVRAPAQLPPPDDPAARATDAVLAHLLAGEDLPNTVLGLKAGKAEGGGRGRTRALEVIVPLVPAFVGRDGDGGYSGELELLVATRDAGGSLSPVHRETFEVRGERPPRFGQHFRYVVGLKTRRGLRQTIAVAVVHEETGTVMTGSIRSR